MTDKPFSKLTWKKEAMPHTRSLTATQLRVLDVVFNHTNAEGKNAHPKQTTIAEMVGVSERQVRRVLDTLQTQGLIECVSRGSARRGEASVYELRLPDIGSPDTEDYRTLLPDIDTVITGHPETDYRTSGELLPDTLDVRPSDPVITDPDNRSGSTDPVEPDIFDVRPAGQDTVGVQPPPDPFAEASISDDRQRQDSTPIASRRLEVADEQDATRSEPVPVSSHQSINPPSGADAPSDPHKPANQGTQPNMNHNDPFALDAASEAAMEAFYSKPTKAYADQAKWEASGWKLVAWPAGKPFPRLGEPGSDPRIRFMDDATGEFIGVCPSPPVVTKPKSVDEFSEALEREWRNNDPVVYRWPTGKPLPVPRDPFATYVDETTGEPLHD